MVVEKKVGEEEKNRKKSCTRTGGARYTQGGTKFNCQPTIIVRSPIGGSIISLLSYNLYLLE